MRLYRRFGSQRKPNVIFLGWVSLGRSLFDKTAITVYGLIGSDIQRGPTESFTFDARFMQKRPSSSCDCLTGGRE
jgi:hypothetical protein